MIQTCLIYKIERLETGDTYVGSTINRTERKSQHYTRLKHNKHHSKHLQNAWNKYGADAFGFGVIEIFEARDKAHRTMVETAWIRLLGTYNVMLAADRQGQFTISEADKAARSEATLRKIEADPEYKAILTARGQSLAALMRTPEYRATMAEHGQRRWQDPTERIKLRAGMAERWENPEKREINVEAQAAAMRAYWKTDGAKEAHSDRMRDQWADPASALRNRSDGRWSDPEAKERQAAKMRAAHAARRAANPKPPKIKKPKPVTMGDLILAELRRNPDGIYAPVDLRNVCDPHRIGTSTLVTVTLGRLCERGLVKRRDGGYQLA